MSFKQIVLLTLTLVISAVALSDAHGRIYQYGHDGWIRNEKDILRGFMNMYNPNVIQIDDKEYPFRMWFFGWLENICNEGYPGCDAIFTARSKDLQQWEVYCGKGKWRIGEDVSQWVPVLTAGDTFYDQWHVGDPSVVFKDGIFYMAFSATGFDLDGIPTGHQGDTDGDISCVMMAKSKDGIVWEKSQYPILIYGPEMGQMEDREADDYVGDFHRPSLMWDESVGYWRVWFDYYGVNRSPGGKKIAVGHAICKGDPMRQENWFITHSLDKPLLIGWPNPNVVKFQGLYYLFSDACSYPKGDCDWTTRQLAEAVSTDGLNWIVRGIL